MLFKQLAMFLSWATRPYVGCYEWERGYMVDKPMAAPSLLRLTKEGRQALNGWPVPKSPERM
jgi:hypothetical protein